MDSSQGSPEGGVLGAGLPQPGPGHLVRIGQAGGHRLADSTTNHQGQEVADCPLAPGSL